MAELISTFNELTEITESTVIHDKVNILLCLLTVDQLNDVVMFKAFHNGDFALEVRKKFTR